jgi:hypothetical protein
MKGQSKTASVVAETAEALSAASKALKQELDGRKKLEDELERTAPELRDALKNSERAQSLAEDVLTQNVSPKVLQIAVQESAEALAGAAAALKDELENRSELEKALNESEENLRASVEKSEAAATRLEQAESEASTRADS